MGTILRITKFLFSLGLHPIAVYSGISFIKERKKFTRSLSFLYYCKLLLKDITCNVFILMFLHDLIGSFVSDISLLRQKRTYTFNWMMPRC